jgi:pectinesterase
MGDYTITVLGINSDSPTRSGSFTTINNTTPTPGVSFTGAVKCRSVEISEIAALGEITLAVQNGSSGNAALLEVQIYNGAAWEKAGEISLEGNIRTLWQPDQVISKSAVKVKFVFPFDCWFYGVEAYDHKDKASAGNAPVFLNATPAAGTNLSAQGSIKLQFDEPVKTTGAPSAVALGDATISSLEKEGNTVKINYTGLTDNPTLTVPKETIVNYGNTPLAGDVVITYAIDKTPPAFLSISPASGSTIHINDLGEDGRKIKLAFDEPVQINEAVEVAFGNGATNAVLKTSVSENTLIISYSGLAYETTNTLAIPGGFITDLSGNAWTGDTYTYHTGIRDNVAPALTSQSVAENAADLPTGGSISFTFDEIVIVNAQTATINGQPAVLSNNRNVIGLNYTGLPYNAPITVNIPAACITDTCGNAFAGATLRFTTGEKTNRLFTSIVAKDDSGDYTTIQAALDAASGTDRTLIYVKPGRYEEKPAVLKDNISLIGENADNVIITWNECATTSTLQNGTGINSTGTDASYTMLIRGSNFYGENFTVRNDYDYASGTDANKQAVAIEQKDGDKQVLKNVKMYSFQDTYYPKSANTRQYLTGCYILGGTDFIFGSGTTFIDNSIIDCFPGGQYITAASDTQKEFGIVINNCEIQYADTTAIGTKRQFYLGRPWKESAKTAYLNCRFENNLVQNAGWSEWSGNENHLTAIYSEYRSALADGNPLNISGRVAWSSQLTETEAARYNPDNAFNYGSNNTWNPAPFHTIPEAITVRQENGTITWTSAGHAAGYILYKNGDYLANLTATTYTDAARTTGDTYKVVAYNAFGALGNPASESTGLVPAAGKSGFLAATRISGALQLQNAGDFAYLEIIALNGQKIASVKITAPSVDVSDLKAGYYLVRGWTKTGERYIDKIIKQ